MPKWHTGDLLTVVCYSSGNVVVNNTIRNFAIAKKKGIITEVCSFRRGNVQVTL